MAFLKGLEKVAGIAGIIGSAAGATKRAVTGTTSAIRGFAKGQRAQKLDKYREAASGGSVKQVGGVSANKAVEKAQQKTQRTITPSEAEGIAKSKSEEAKKRLENVKGIQAKNKPSFARRHPVATTLATVGAAHSIMGSGDDQKQQQPPPQISYY